MNDRPRDEARGVADDLDVGDEDEAAKKAIEAERAEITEFVSGLSAGDIKSGNWFSKLLAYALHSYAKKVDWQYFQERYEGVPPDAIVDQRIKMAARYAAIEGGLSASAYTGAVAATIGTAGGASPALVPAALATVMVDVAYISQLQMRLAYDIAILYRLPLDLDDPDDLWKLIRVAFTIRSGEAVREGVIKVAPALVRPVVKRFVTGPVLVAAKGLPIVGKFLLQRNIIKIGIPLVGIPLAVVVNRYSTAVTGRHARAVFRNEARIIELAGRLCERTRHPELLLWLTWIVTMADNKIDDDEALLIRLLVRMVRDRHGVVDERLASVVDVDRDEFWQRLEAERGDLSDLEEAASLVAKVDGPTNAREDGLLSELSARIGGTQGDG